MQNLNLNIAVNDRVRPSCDVEERQILHAESLRLVWTKYENYILHTSAVMYTFQNLNSCKWQCMT